MKSRLLFPLFSLLLATASCTKDKKTDVEGEWLFPIAKGALSINTISQLRNLEYHISVPPPSINQPVNIPVSSPGLQLAHVGPFAVRITDWLKRMDVDTLEFSGSLQNFFPIPIGPGTLVTMRNTRDTTAANILGSALVSTTVAPGARFSFDIRVLGKTVYDSVFFTLDQFNSPAYSNVTFSTTPTTLDITLKVITANYLEVYTGKTFSSRDTVEFDAGSDDNLGSQSGGILSDTGTSGYITVFADNGLPANVRGELYFMDASRSQILDSLFVPGLVVQGGKTDGAGNTSFTASEQTTSTISRRRLNNIKAAKFIATDFLFNTSGYSGSYVAANRTPKLAIQITGDLNIRIKF